VLEIILSANSASLPNVASADSRDEVEEISVRHRELVQAKRATGIVFGSLGRTNSGRCSPAGTATMPAGASGVAVASAPETIRSGHQHQH
jgi:hypothetical protein